MHLNWNTKVEQVKKIKPVEIWGLFEGFNIYFVNVTKQRRNLNMIFITSIQFEPFNSWADSLGFFKFNWTLHFNSTESGYIYYYYYNYL